MVDTYYEESATQGTVKVYKSDVKVSLIDEHGHKRVFIMDTYLWEELVRSNGKFKDVSLVKRLVEKEAAFPVEVSNVNG